jgi:hypothetical protein
VRRARGLETSNELSVLSNVSLGESRPKDEDVTLSRFVRMKCGVHCSPTQVVGNNRTSRRIGLRFIVFAHIVAMQWQNIISVI